MLVADNSVKHAFQILDLVVYLLDELVFRFLEDSVFHLDIDSLDLPHQADCALPNALNLVKDATDLAILSLKVFDQAIDALEVLIAVNVLRHRVPFLLHVLKDLLFVSDLLDHGLELLLKVFNLG